MEDANFRTNKEILDDGIKLNSKMTTLQKVSILLSCILVMYILALLALNFIINTNEIKNSFNTNIKNILKIDANSNTSFEIAGDIKFNSFLSPHLTIKNIKAKNLIQDNYQMDFNIEEITLYISAEHLFAKKIFVEKTEITNGNFLIKEIKETSNIKNINDIINKYSANLISNSNVKVDFKNSSIHIETDSFTRHFDNINTSNVFNRNRLEISGGLLSNKQPLGINFKFRKNKDNKKLNLELFSQAFSLKSNAEIALDNSSLKGALKYNIVNLQIFTKTLFNTNSFLYQRIIDNSTLKGNLDFNYANNMLEIKNLLLDGNNIKGIGDAKININNNGNNKINFNIDSINVDNLISKNFINKTSNFIDQDDIFIFSGKEKKVKTNNINNSYLKNLFNSNKNNINIMIKNAILNKAKLSNIILNFDYSQNNNIKINNFSGILAGNTKILVQKDKSSDNTSLTMSGDNLEEFWNFLKNTQYIKKNEAKKFIITGNVNIKNNKIFFNNLKFNTNNIETLNTIEIAINNGISYIAADININDIILDKIFYIDEINNTQTELLKNKMLFLNDFSLNSFLRFHADKIQYKNIVKHNANFVAITSQGILSIKDINLNNMITGNIDFNIRTTKPMLNALLNINNYTFENKIPFNDLLFHLPVFQDYMGEINININNSKFIRSPINEAKISAKLTDGVLTINNFNIDGFGGKCSITGFLDLNYNKKFNLVLNGCTGDLKDLMYLFTNQDNISGLIGFSSIIYANGDKLDIFTNNYIFKIQLIGSNIVINNFGLEELNMALLKLNTSPELAKTLNSNALLVNPTKQTTFTNLSGTIQYNNTNGQINLDITRPLINGKISGTFNFSNKGLILNSYANFIMLVGTLNKAINLTLPISITGTLTDGFKSAINYQQISDYINTIKSVK